MIDQAPFGRTGHDSTRVIFGAAALGAMSPKNADKVLAVIDEFGVNHLDTAAMYGDSELRLAPLLRASRDRFFLATKTRERTRAGAAAGLRRSLERLEVDHVDLIQLHNLVDPAEWETALGPGGALEALVEARDEGLVRFIGVTGHGPYVAAMHSRSLERFAFDSVLCLYNFAMMRQADYASDFEALVSTCRDRGVAIQTIKALARRRWPEDHDGHRFAWYEPLTEAEPVRRAVHYVLSRPELFLNSSSDATLLRATLEAAAEPVARPPAAAMQTDADQSGIQPLFEPGGAEVI